MKYWQDIILIVIRNSYTQTAKPQTIANQKVDVAVAPKELGIVEADKKNDEESLNAIEFITTEAEAVLIPEVYQKHSLYRMVGCFIVLLGLVLLRNLKSIGYHLLVAGLIFTLFTGFYTFGLGVFGWLFNLYYMCLAAFSIFYYTRKRALLT